MIAPSAYLQTFVAVLETLQKQIEAHRICGRGDRLRIRMSRLCALAYRRLYRERCGKVDKWEREGWDFLGVPIYEDVNNRDFHCGLDAMKASAHKPLKFVRGPAGAR